MTTEAEAEPHAPDSERPETRWGAARGTVRIVTTYFLGLAFTATGVFVHANRYGVRPLSKAFRPWDSGYYVLIAKHGYNLLNITQSGPQKQNNTAFFPGYPMVIRLVVELFGWAGVGYHAAAWMVNIGSGLAAMLVIAAVVRHYYPEAVAVRTAQAVALFPGAAVLLFGYAEGLFLLLAACCVLAVIHQRWWWAGCAALAASGVRANGIYLTLLLAGVAVHAIWTRRDWLSLVAPLLAPWGFLAYQGHLWHITGRRDEWFAVEHYGWRQRNDFGAETIRALTGAHPLSRALVVLQLVGASYLILVAVLAASRRVKLPGLLLGYTAITVLPLFVASRIGLRPRFLLEAFPLMLITAVALRSYAFVALCVVGAAGLVWSGYVYAGSFPP